MEEIIFKTSVDTGSTVKDLQNVEKELSNINEESAKMGNGISSKFEALNEKVAKGGLSIREYGKAVREYQAIALEAGRTSPIGQEALNQAGQLKDKLQDLQQETTRLGQDGANMKAALQMGSVVTAGYGAVQGAMALTGVESEKLQETMVKLQAVTTILNGLEQIRTALEKESLVMIKGKAIATNVMTAAQYVYTVAVGTTTGAMKALRIAMLAVPLFAIIAGIVALIGALDAMFPKIKSVEELNNELTASYERQIDVIERAQNGYKRDIDNKIKLAKSMNASAEEMHLLEMERIRREEVVRIQSTQVSASLLDKKTQLYKKALKQENWEQAKKIQEEIQAEKKKFADLNALNGQYSINRKIAENEFNNEQKAKEEQANKEAQDRAKQANDKRKQLLEERRKKAEEEAQKQLELERTLQDLALAYMVDGEDKQRAELAIQQQREREDLIKKYGQNTKLLAELKTKQLNEVNDLETQILLEQKTVKDEADKLALEKANTDKQAMLEGKLIQMRGDFDAEMALKQELADLEYQQAISNKELTEGERFKIDQEYAQKTADLDAQKVAQEEATNEAIVKSRQEFAGAIANVFGQLAGLAKEGSKAQKAFALAEIGINTAVGFVQGLRIAQAAAIKSPTPALTFGIFYAQQLASVLGAAKQAKSILGASGGVSAPTVGGGSGGSQGGQTTQPTETGQNVNTQSNLTSGLQGGGGSRVYVVDSDITDVQKQTEKVNAVSTIG